MRGKKKNNQVLESFLFVNFVMNRFFSQKYLEHNEAIYLRGGVIWPKLKPSSNYQLHSLDMTGLPNEYSDTTQTGSCQIIQCPPAPTGEKGYI